MDIFRRPEHDLEVQANQMLAIIFDPASDEAEVRAAALTLVEIVAPDVLEDSVPKVAVVDVSCTCPTLDGIKVVGSACPIHGFETCEI